MNWLLVFIGGGIGSVVRFGIGKWMSGVTASLPLSTFLSNVIASAVLGFIWFSPVFRADKSWAIPLIAVGFCGGLSTFSTFSLETFQMFRSGQWLPAGLNILFSTAICIAVIWVASRSTSE